MADYKHLHKLSDSNGILQFSHCDIPDQRSGYTLDDNARALIVSIIGDIDEDLAACYASYLNRAQRPDSWSNFELDHQFSSRFDSEDSIGRALLACCVGSSCQWPGISILCKNMLKDNLPRALSFSSPRAIAYTLVGLCKGAIPASPSFLPLVDQLSHSLISFYQNKKERGWLWFENYLTYCNGILPQALLAAYMINGDKKALQIGRDSLNFLNEVLFREGYLNIIGNQGWYCKGGSVTRFDQQPVDAASTYFACMEAYETTGCREYLELAQTAYAWFRGKNVHGLSLYNPATGGCYDALTAEGVNLNQGAESTLALLLCDS